MADDDYEMEWGSDDGNDMGAEGCGDEAEILLQNNFYEAEGLLKSDPQQALELFDTVVSMEENRDSKDFSFNAIKYMVILAMQLGQYEKMLKSQK
jgi:hypothetical protein